VLVSGTLRVVELDVECLVLMCSHAAIHSDKDCGVNRINIKTFSRHSFVY